MSRIILKVVPRPGEEEEEKETEIVIFKLRMEGTDHSLGESGSSSVAALPQN